MDFASLRNDPTLWAILQARAAALAVQTAEHDGERGEEVVVFQLGAGRYSMPAKYIREVQPLTALRRLPGTAACMLGLVNLRGQLLCVIDLAPLLDIPRASRGPGALLIFISVEGVDLALAADLVAEVRHGHQSLSPSLTATSGSGLPWVKGIDEELTVVLDIPLLLRDPRLLANPVAD